jgi:Na+-transporting NADH:ubiquinone oxidoreductase subunit A
MKRIELKKGLDIPISGEPEQRLTEKKPVPVSKIALTADDYIGMKPTMEVEEGERVKTGQLLFTDKKTEGIRYTSPATGKVIAINRGAKRKFETIVIEIEEDDHVSFVDPAAQSPDSFDSEGIREILQKSGMWCSFRTRPFGKVPAISSSPAVLFITATDTRPLAADPAVVINASIDHFACGLEVLARFHQKPSYLCLHDSSMIKISPPADMEVVEFSGPHPAGLPSTHIHMLDQARESRIIWHIDYQDVIAIGHLFTTGYLQTEKVIALAGPSIDKPRLITIRLGSDIHEICAGELFSTPTRVVSGSILDGREVDDVHHFVGRYHNQISALHDGSGRSPFSWAMPGSDRFSIKSLFTSALHRTRKFAMSTALWGGERAIYPVDSYDRVMPLDIVPLALLKSIAVCDTEKSRNLGALELIEEDLALCSFVCPGKNNFGPMLRRVLTEIELEG